jgi:hypothetical protein
MLPPARGVIASSALLEAMTTAGASPTMRHYATALFVFTVDMTRSGERAQAVARVESSVQVNDPTMTAGVNF